MACRDPVNKVAQLENNKQAQQMDIIFFILNLLAELI